MKEQKYNFLIILASILSVFAFIFLAYRVHISRETTHLVYTTLYLIFTAQFLIFLNGIVNSKFHTYIPAFIIICLISYILYIKITNETLIY